VTQRRYPLEFQHNGEVIEMTNPSTLAVNEANAYTTSLLSGQGVGQITSYQAREYLKSGQLVQILPEWTQPLLPVYVVYPPNSHLSAKVRAFVDWVVEIFAADPLLQCK
jgi:DNA-binding transcriptional LysR family regulator